MTRSILILALSCGAAILSAQVPAQESSTLRFEVASVKPASSDSTRNTYRPDPARFRGTFTVTGAVGFAYQVEQSRIVQAPQWAKEQRYEINATTPPRKPGDIQSMMRHLLEERFALKVHRERRPIPVYVLSLSRSDGRLGPRLQRVERDCTRPAANLSGCSASFGPAHYRSSGQDWRVFVTSLDTRITGRPIVDKTGLSGQVDITLEWNPDVTRVPASVSDPPTLTELEAPPGLFTALQEQLGLKLESDTAAMDVLVIDSVSRPTPD
jgi:uncharacterized protein (TIGR03435 family)